MPIDKIARFGELVKSFLLAPANKSFLVVINVCENSKKVIRSSQTCVRYLYTSIINRVASFSAGVLVATLPKTTVVRSRPHQPPPRLIAASRPAPAATDQQLPVPTVAAGLTLVANGISLLVVSPYQ